MAEKRKERNNMRTMANRKEGPYGRMVMAEKKVSESKRK
jgi:hypothetical protein